ncbi:5'-nucleotidase /3'-nucleotidase /exopolyphosphatase [Humidesulfovibrio mexicanus]|uniref:5'-nucleotidase SurE n=1 Tax=Humidesulfovibrio mexicanus TaxID=147047 RepID=A0A238ZD53_9BACT|nr:5'/3'-nucleotidase SurE [Humidesulfovibrio mexicanus]SNR81267.1 5'-nucleotidase /3'-nucleotidase /exopolyphosphatase [Humidesulfovibrio mexicanus]
MRILLTNDDGIQAVGLRAMHAALVAAGHEVHVVAPVTEQSAVGHAITLAAPLRVKEFRDEGFFGLGVTGTPADCVKLALSTLVKEKPDMVISGINAGANVGVDILYSGTVSAATEGALMGCAAMAVSMDDFNPRDLSSQAAYAVALLPRLPLDRLPEKCVLNLNFPVRPVEEMLGLRLCPHTRVAYEDWFEERLDPRGRPYYWMCGELKADRISQGRDRRLLTEGWATLTPLKFDFTDHEMLGVLEPMLSGTPC